MITGAARPMKRLVMPVLIAFHVLPSSRLLNTPADFDVA